MSKAIIELEDGWGQVTEKGINHLIKFLEGDEHATFTRKLYSELYTIVYNMCTQQRQKNFTKQIYERYGETLESYISSYLIPSLTTQDSSLTFLTSLRVSWDKYQKMTKWLKHFCQYLDRHHVTQNSLPGLQEVSNSKFLALVVEKRKDQITSNFKELFEKDRKGEDLDREILRDVFRMLQSLDQSKLESSRVCPEIEQHIIEQTSDFFFRISSAWLTDDGLPDYLKKAEDYLKLDRARTLFIMNEAATVKVENKFLEVVIKNNIQKLLEKETGMNYLLNHNLRPDLLRLHVLTASISICKEKIAVFLKDFIKSEGENVIEEKKSKSEALAEEKKKKGEPVKKDSPEDPDLVKNMIKLLKRFKSLLEESFKNDSFYQRSINSGYSDVINKRIGKHTFAEILACYLDKLLKKSNNRMSDQEIEEELVNVISVFEHLEDKQLFAEIFKNQLAKRLLNDQSANSDAERSIISKMKMICGSNFTNKMEGMNNDLKLAEEILNKFQSSQAHRSELAIEFKVQVLTNSHWPAFKNNAVKLPQQMQDSVDRFRDFFSLNNPRKKLLWMISLGTLEISKTFDSGTYDFLCSLNEGLTLMLFNETPRLSFQEIRLQMGFDHDFCKKILNVFLNRKHKILEKVKDDGKKACEDDVFQVNHAFRSQTKKVKLPIPSQDENFEKEKVAEDRNHAIDASIVRIMKSRKSLAHNALITEVISVLQIFRPQIRDIKQRIENLISREFLERDRNDHNSYNYLA
jgi:cullin 1